MQTGIKRKKRKYKTDDAMSIEEIYDLVIIGKKACNKQGIRGKSRFPAGCWSEVGKYERGRRVVRYMIRSVLNWDREQICKGLTTETFIDNYLKGCLANVYSNSAYEALKAAIPEENIMPWELSQVPRNYWNEITGKLATRWLILEKHKMTREKVKELLTYDFFEENGLGGMLATLYHDSPFEALNAAFPDEYMPWELLSCPQDFWNEKTVIQAIRWLILVKLKWSRKEVCEKYSDKVLEKNDLGGMPYHLFGGTVYKGLALAFPDEEYMAWELSSCPQRFWKDDENIKASLMWVKRKFPNATVENFKSNGLGGLLNHMFGGNISRAFSFLN